MIVSALVVVLRSLDRPWLKRHLVAMARQNTGLDVDWTATHVSIFSGLRIDRLTVMTPPALRAVTPELVRVDGLTVTWTARSLVAGTPRFGALRAESVALTLVRDAAGRTSLTTIEPHGDGKPAPPEQRSTPPSKQAADALAGPPPVGRIDVEHATVTVLAQSAGAPRERLRVDGIALHATLKQAGRAFALAAELGTPEAPLVLTIDRTRDGAAAGEARARLAAQLAASPAEATAKIDLEVLSQTLAPETKVKEVAHLEADARFGDGRVHVTVHKTRVGDGAATTEAELELPDGGAPRVVHAEGTIDLPRVLALLPSSLVPVEAERAHLTYRVDGMRASVEGELGRVRVLGARGNIVADGGKLSITARPEGGATVVHAVVPLESLSLPGVAAEKLHATVDGRLAADGALSGDARVKLGAVRASGKTRASISDGELVVHAESLRVDPATPLRTTGDVKVELGAASVDAVAGTTHVVADGVDVAARAAPNGKPPYSLSLLAPIARLRVSEGRGKPLVDAPVRLSVMAADLRPDLTKPRRSGGVATIELTLGALHATVDATKWAEAVDYKLRADAGSLALIAPLVAHDKWQAPWDKMSLTVASEGRVERFSAPSLREHTTLALQHAAWKGPNGSVAADRLELEATSNGNAVKHELSATIRTRALRVDGASQGDAALDAKVRFDARAPSAHVVVATVGDAGPKLKLDAALGFVRARRAVTWDVDAAVSRLSSLAPLTQGGLSGFDFDNLAVALKGAGSFTGLVRDVDGKGRVRVEPDPLRTLAADGGFDLAVDALDWSRGDRELGVPHARWSAKLSTEGTVRKVHGLLTVDSLELDFGDHELVFRDLRDDIEASIDGDLRAGIAALDHRLAVKKISQDFAAPYRLGDVTLNVRANRDADGVVHIAEISLGNRAGGSTLTMRGGLDAGRERRSLALRGELKQDLSRLWAVPQQLQGRGTASVQLRLSSGNLRTYHVLAAVRVAGATVELPKSNIKIESMDGEIPLTADLVADADGMHLLHSTDINAYSELRFADQHPLLSRPSFLSIAKITTPFISIAPLAGNLRVDDNIISLNQLEIGVRGGRVTGQCIVDWRGGSDAKVQMRVRASDVKSSHGEPFDGNAAIDLSTKDRSVDGRAEILRIGKRHLYDLLDLDDPHHSDAAINRVRRALALGYPDHVRLTFKHGFADARIAFGGLARLIRVDDIRGIPMGPLIDRILSPLKHREEDEE